MLKIDRYEAIQRMHGLAVTRKILRCQERANSGVTSVYAVLMAAFPLFAQIRFQ
jgi:hypothetical protein